ncbi:terpene synthase family protein [Paraliomyxa miuraensis]|uniref:terpene synthase family protein n=1 Tax=Paraliomyxa miuraensis TaxID=376150 RepID=UPI0022513776|nr:terpene synthase family protein [Paraliomyxa miuraensis]MCX4242471.1 terpene synthase family protein [Paraliomyxa miuraensis]
MADYYQLVEKHRDRVPIGFDRWVHHFGIQDDVSPILFTVVTWVKYCSWADATEEQHVLACMDLAISFFYLDDYQEDDYPDLFDDFRRNLKGEEPLSRRPAVLAHADLLRRLRALNRPMDDFLAIRLRLLDEYMLRNAAMRGRARLTFERYWQCRLVTIDVQQWVELWLLLWDFRLTSEERSNRELNDAVRLAATFFFLGNDLYSFERDAAKGEPNLVCLWRDERGVSLAQAASAIDGMRVEALDEFYARVDALVGESSAEHLRHCGRLLRRFVDHAATARHDNPERYVKPDQLLSPERAGAS